MPWDCACGARGIDAPFCASCGRWAPMHAPPLPVAGPVSSPVYVPPPPSRGGVGRVVLAGAAAAVAFVVMVATAGFFQGFDLRGGADPFRHSAAFDAVVADLEAFVATAHGGAFVTKVDIATLGDDEFVDEVLAGDDADPFSRTLTGLGLAGNEDPDAVRADLLASGIVGMYDHTDDVLYVRGERTTPYARLVLVHELTHAWQDQQYDLDAVFDRADTLDADRAIRALVEGDAVRVEHAWERTQPKAVRDDIEREDSSDTGNAEEPTVAADTTEALLDFSYVVGERFVATLVAKGGNDEIGVAFRDPPVSTEQVMHPERFLTPQVPQHLSEPVPPPGSRTEDSGTLGELGIAVFAARGWPGRAVLTAVDGWDGDSYVTWEADGRVCTQDDVAMDTPAARDRLRRFLAGRSLGAHGSVTAVGARRLTVVSCAAA